MDHECDGHANSRLCAWNSSQVLGKETGGIRNQRGRIQTIQTTKFVKIGKNIQKNPGNLGIFAVT